MGCKECRTKPCCDAQEVECCSKCEHLKNCKSSCEKAKVMTTSKETKDRILTERFERTNKVVEEIFQELKNRGYECKIEYNLNYYQHIGTTKQSQVTIKFTDLKVRNNSFSIDCKLFEDEKQWFVHLWKYDGKHTFHKIDADIDKMDFEDYKKEIDWFFYGIAPMVKPQKEESNQISIFDLL